MTDFLIYERFKGSGFGGLASYGGTYCNIFDE